MKQITLLSIVISLIISCAVPIGTAFAFDDIQPAEIDPQENNEAITPEEEGSPPSVDEVAKEELIVSVSEVSITNADTIPTTNDVSEEGESSEAQLEEPSLADDTPVLPVTLDGVVISRVQATGGTGKTDQELVELYNNADIAVDITDWCLESYKQSKPTEAIGIGCITLPSGIGWRVFLPARTAYVFTTSAFNVANKDIGGRDFVPDQVFAISGAFNNDTGRVILRDASGAARDALTWGSEGELPVDQGTTRASISKMSYTLERRFDGVSLRYQDTDDNSADFMTDVMRSVYSTGGATEIYDACLNVNGVQSSEGELYRDELTGECTQTPPFVNTCSGILLSEIAANVDEQFIEVRNDTSDSLSLAGCQLQTNRSTKTFVFSDEMKLGAGKTLAVLIADTSLLLTKTTSGTVYLLSSDGRTEVDSVNYSNLLAKTSWGFLGGGEWKQTYTITPNSQNIYAQYPPCDDGYARNLKTGRCNRIEEPVLQIDCGEGRERNPATGRCRNTLVIPRLVPCRDGQYRSEETNRCRSLAVAVAHVLKPCADGQFRNPETNRCKKIASSEDIALADCGEGRERNPLTNRCRNVIGVTASTGTLPFPVEQVEEGTKRFASWWALSVVTFVGVGYGVWEWRVELLRAVKGVHQFIRRGK